MEDSLNYLCHQIFRTRIHLGQFTSAFAKCATLSASGLDTKILSNDLRHFLLSPFSLFSCSSTSKHADLHLRLDKMCFPCWPWGDVYLEDEPRKKGVLHYDPVTRTWVGFEGVKVSWMIFIALLILER